jgi:hypothetical protein
MLRNNSMGRIERKKKPYRWYKHRRIKSKGSNCNGRINKKAQKKEQKAGNTVDAP